MRLAVIGPQNTGKSTFIEDFVKAYPEYKTPGKKYRDVISEKGLEINQKTTDESQRLIRDFLFDQLKNNKEKNIIIDRSIIDNYIYTLYQFQNGIIEKNFLKETEEIMYGSLSMLDGFIFIPTAVGVSLVTDNVRDTDRIYIDTINRMFIDTLFKITSLHPIKIFTITGDRKKRIELIKEKLS